ncbi:MAG: hypothetical protein GC171_15765 [Terrimonas sp.]|nr:hypothetical protein [Terrimonas sp.]
MNVGTDLIDIQYVMFTHRYRYFFIGLLSLYTFMNTALCNVYHYFSIDIEWYYALLTIFLITFGTWEANRLVNPFVKKRIPPEENRFRYLFTFFGTGLVISFILSFGIVMFIGAGLHHNTWSQNLNPLKLNLIYAGLINLFFHLLNTIFFFFSAYKKQWAEAEELRRISSQAEIQLVKSQINPHFLFNNLNVLSNMVMKDNPEANKFIEEFSKVYRYILNNHQKEVVELRSELAFIRPYIFLLEQRFAEGLKVDIQIPEKYNTYFIIPVALQMLIENAIKHNIVSRSKPLVIELHANGNQTLVVRNNLQPRAQQEFSNQIGLKNIMKRYELISDKNVSVKKSETFFEVELPLLNLN